LAGLQDLKEELMELAQKMKKLLDHNILVYRKIYDQIIKTKKKTSYSMPT
jgi:predicted nucleic acid-binding protein